MDLSERDFITLRREDIGRVARLIAAFRDEKIVQLAERIQKRTEGPIVRNLKRDALPNAFRVELFKEFTALHQHSQTAIATSIGFTQTARRRPIEAPSAFGYQRSLQRTFADWFDPNLYAPWGNEDRMLDWPEPRYLLLRLFSDDVLRVSHMKIDFGQSRRAAPGFTTVRQTEHGQRKTVRGIVLQTESEMYTIGRLERGNGLRFSRLKKILLDANDEWPSASSAGHLTAPPKDRLDLYGLRLGHSPANYRSYAHVIYGRQLPTEKADEAIEVLKGTGGSLLGKDDPDLLRFVPELPDLMAHLRGAETPGGIQPLHWDAA